MWCLYLSPVQLLSPVTLPRDQEGQWGKTGEDWRRNLENRERIWKLMIIANLDFIRESVYCRNRKLKMKGVLWFSRERSWPAAGNSCLINADSQVSHRVGVCITGGCWCVCHLGCCWICLVSFSHGGELSRMAPCLSGWTPFTRTPFTRKPSILDSK